MNLVQFPRANVNDVAARLREMADWVDSVDEDVTVVLVLGRASQAVHVYGYGHRTSGLEVQGWLARAAAHVMNAVRSFQTEAS
jgi:hypothetical protein